MSLPVLVRDLSFFLYAAAVIWAALRLLSPQGKKAPWPIFRSFQRQGPGMGIVLGTTILGLVWAHWSGGGGFGETMFDLTTPLEVGALGSFFLLWLSYIKLEVWTLEVFRKLERAHPDEKISHDDVSVVGPIRRHLLSHAGLVLLTLGLSVAAHVG